jgi:aldehyde dehydrogenase (NAD+)
MTIDLGALRTAASAHPFLRGEHMLLINGKWVPSASGETFDAVNPSSGEKLGTIPLGDAEDINRAVIAARNAFESGWGRTKPFERQQLLLRLADLVEEHFDELASLDSLDMGGPISRTRLGKKRAVGMLRYYAGLATAIHGNTIENSIVPGEYLSYSTKEPVGVVGAIIPWNGPLGLSIWMTAPALATGCTVVLKPSEDASFSPLRFGELLMEAGYPPGVLNIVTGRGSAGAALAAHPDVNKVSFTGSTATGQEIIRASAVNVKRLSLELGGKSPDIVFADADLDAAVPGAAMAAFANSGQICSAGTRLFVQRSIYDEFVERVAAHAKSLRVGHSLDPDTQIGPLTSARQLEKVCGYFEAGKAEGARVQAGATRLTTPDLEKGFFVAPTVFSGVQASMRIAREEIFGPVISALPFDDIDDVVQKGNDTNFGLASGVWTKDVGKAHQVASRLRAGSVWINCYQAMDPAIPFGGYKMSGYGRVSGVDHVEEYLETKAVVLKYA